VEIFKKSVARFEMILRHRDHINTSGGIANTKRFTLVLQRHASCVVRVLHHRVRHARRVAFAMAQHPRLGAGAAVGGLEPGLVRDVLVLAGLELLPGFTARQ
jgi:hypothetical protein